ncbi:MAG: YegP family protein [Acidobacteriota bacterium]
MSDVKNPKYQIYAGKNDKTYFRLNAKNGQQILASQGYASKSGAKNGIESVRKNAPDDANFDRKTASNGKFFFNLLAANKQIIGSSQMYASEAARDNGIESVQTNADSPVEDLTAAG